MAGATSRSDALDSGAVSICLVFPLCIAKNQEELSNGASRQMVAIKTTSRRDVLKFGDEGGRRRTMWPQFPQTIDSGEPGGISMNVLQTRHCSQDAGFATTTRPQAAQSTSVPSGCSQARSAPQLVHFEIISDGPPLQGSWPAPLTWRIRSLSLFVVSMSSPWPECPASGKGSKRVPPASLPRRCGRTGLGVNRIPDWGYPLKDNMA